MKIIKLSISLVLFFLIVQFSEGKHTRIIVHFNNHLVDTLHNSGILISISGQYYIPGDAEEIFPSETKQIIINVDGVPVKGIPAGDVWFFKIHSGNPVSIYSTVPKTYHTNDFYFSDDEINFIPYNRSNVKEIFKTDKDASKKLKRHLSKRRFQKALLYSNVTGLYGLASMVVPNPIGAAFIGYSVLSTAASKAMEKSVQRKLFVAIDLFNSNQRMAYKNAVR